MSPFEKQNIQKVIVIFFSVVHKRTNLVSHLNVVFKVHIYIHIYTYLKYIYTCVLRQFCMVSNFELYSALYRLWYRILDAWNGHWVYVYMNIICVCMHVLTYVCMYLCTNEYISVYMCTNIRGA
jgi:hypothetical protein